MVPNVILQYLVQEHCPPLHLSLQLRGFHSQFLGVQFLSLQQCKYDLIFPFNIYTRRVSVSWTLFWAIHSI